MVHRGPFGWTKLGDGLVKDILGALKEPVVLAVVALGVIYLVTTMIRGLLEGRATKRQRDLLERIATALEGGGDETRATDLAQIRGEVGQLLEGAKRQHADALNQLAHAAGMAWHPQWGWHKPLHGAAPWQETQPPRMDLPRQGRPGQQWQGDQPGTQQNAAPLPPEDDGPAADDTHALVIDDELIEEYRRRYGEFTGFIPHLAATTEDLVIPGLVVYDVEQIAQTPTAQWAFRRYIETQAQLYAGHPVDLWAKNPHSEAGFIWYDVMWGLLIDVNGFVAYVDINHQLGRRDDPEYFAWVNSLEG